MSYFDKFARAAAATIMTRLRVRQELHKILGTEKTTDGTPWIEPRVQQIMADEIAQIINAAMSEASGVTPFERYQKLAAAAGGEAGSNIFEVVADAYEAAEERLRSDQKYTYQSRVKSWMLECFGADIAGDKIERNHRFLEEALELVQACGASKGECVALVDYVYDRPIGEPSQEVGGVMVTLAALCEAQGVDMRISGETELARVWTKIPQIRAKQAAKPKHSPLPGPATAE